MRPFHIAGLARADDSLDEQADEVLELRLRHLRARVLGDLGMQASAEMGSLVIGGGRGGGERGPAHSLPPLVCLDCARKVRAIMRDQLSTSRLA